MSNELQESRFITDSVNAGVARLRESEGVSRTPSDPSSFGTPDLEDVDGVGPATADKLREAGVNNPNELTRLTPSQLEAVDGIGAKRADKIARKYQYGPQYRFQNPESDPQDVREAHSERSPEARRADRSFNAEITLDEEEWLENPAQHDFPGVDTVPEARRAERARTAAQRAGAKAVESGNLSGNTQGRQTGGRIQVDPSENDPVSTFAHEVGHLVEPKRGFAEENIFEDSEELRQQAATLSERRRFTLESTTPDDVRDKFTQDEDSELFADAVGVAIEEPRAARREAPELVSKIEQEFPGELPGRRG